MTNLEGNRNFRFRDVLDRHPLWARISSCRGVSKFSVVDKTNMPDTSIFMPLWILSDALESFSRLSTAVVNKNKDVTSWWLECAETCLFHEICFLSMVQMILLLYFRWFGSTRFYSLFVGYFGIHLWPLKVQSCNYAVWYKKSWKFSSCLQWMEHVPNKFAEPHFLYSFIWDLILICTGYYCN